MIYIFLSNKINIPFLWMIFHLFLWITYFLSQHTLDVLSEQIAFPFFLFIIYMIEMTYIYFYVYGMIFPLSLFCLIFILLFIHIIKKADVNNINIKWKIISLAIAMLKRMNICIFSQRFYFLSDICVSDKYYNIYIFILLRLNSYSYSFSDKISLFIIILTVVFIWI